MRNLRPTPAHQLCIDVNSYLTDIGQSYLGSMVDGEFGRFVKQVGTDNAERIAEEIEYAALSHLADCDPSSLPQAWHEGIAAAMHSLPIDCDPYKGGSEYSIAYRCGHRFATEND